MVARILGVDIRRRGSGNIGATNVLRTAGWTPALATLLGDIVKGYVATWIGSLAAAEPAWAAARRRSSPSPATAGRSSSGSGAARASPPASARSSRSRPWALIPAAVVFASLIASFRFVSLASLCAVVGLPLAILALGYPAALALAGLAVAIIVIARHHANIQRLLAGTEARFGERAPVSAAGAPPASSSPR